MSSHIEGVNRDNGSFLTLPLFESWFLTNDNDFVSYVAKDAGSSANVLAPADNPNRIFVFAFDDADLPLPGKVQAQRLQQQHQEHYDAPFFGGFGPPSDYFWP